MFFLIAFKTEELCNALQYFIIIKDHITKKNAENRGSLLIFNKRKTPLELKECEATNQRRKKIPHTHKTVSNHEYVEKA